MKLPRGQSLYHKEPPFCDLSDGMTMPQQLKIITVLCRISNSYLRKPARVKSKLDDLGPLLQVILAVNLTFFEI